METRVYIFALPAGYEPLFRFSLRFNLPSAARLAVLRRTNSPAFRVSLSDQPSAQHRDHHEIHAKAAGVGLNGSLGLAPAVPVGDHNDQ